ncbi:MAG: 4-hydroxy-tetrahydrodipicolinate reductase [Planctomycetota bacterium]
MRVAFAGFGGKMGRALMPGLEAASDLEIVARISRGDDLAASLESSSPDVLLDFTRPDLARAHVQTALECGVRAVSGTTGFTTEDFEALRVQAKSTGLAALIVPNFSIGAVLLMKLASEAAPHFEGVEIIESHHAAKLDAPSGTAVRTAELVARRLGPERAATAPGDEDPARGRRVEGIPVHSIRLPGCVAHQEVVFGTTGQTLTLRHDVMDRGAFLPGVLLALRRVGSSSGLTIGLESLLFGDGDR